jgi:hypothetical protein
LRPPLGGPTIEACCTSSPPSQPPLGLLATAFAWLWLLGQAFTESIPWGVACLLLPPASLAFVAVHWEARAQTRSCCRVLGVAAVLFAGWADHTALPAWVPSAW